jgi:hypothetical protein
MLGADEPVKIGTTGTGKAAENRFVRVIRRHGSSRWFFQYFNDRSAGSTSCFDNKDYVHRARGIGQF